MRIKTTRRRIAEEGRLSRDAIKSRSDRIECFAQKMVEARGIERSPNFATQWDHATSFEFLQTSFPAPRNVAHINARLVSRPVPSGQGGGGLREEIPWPRADEFTRGNFLAKDHFGFGEFHWPPSCRSVSSRLLDSASSRYGRFPRCASEKIALCPATATARTLHDSRIHSRRACPALTHATFTTRMVRGLV